MDFEFVLDVLMPPLGIRLIEYQHEDSYVMSLVLLVGLGDPLIDVIVWGIDKSVREPLSI
jgi:hypothetical protein